MNEKTKARWSSFNNAEVSIPYEVGIVEPYMVSFWTVREGGEVPGVIRYSRRTMAFLEQKISGPFSLPLKATRPGACFRPTKPGL